MLKRLLSWTRFVVVVPVIGTFLGSVTLMGYAGYETVQVIIEAATGHLSERETALAFIEFADTFLLATVLYIIALGLYELFIDDTLPLPAWLEIHTLDDLKEKLVGVIIVVLAVLFLGAVVRGSSGLELLELGGAIAAVIAALSYFLGRVAAHK